jgi:hypothetical protein
VATTPLEVLVDELEPPPEEPPFRAEAFRTLLTEEIGYSVVGRGTVGLIFGGFLLAALALGMALRRSRRPELVGWLAPAAAVGAAVVFVVLGEASRRAAPPTVAVAQLVHAVAGREEAAVHGLLAVYRPNSGPAEVGAGRGGLFELDMTAVEGQTRRLVMTDLGAWHWENLALPAGVRFAPFHHTVATGEPLAAVARFGPEGLQGKLTTGPFRNAGDAIVVAAGGRSLALNLAADGAFRAGSKDVLARGQFLAGAVLSDRQQRRQELYREFLKRPEARPLKGRTLLLAWADPVDPGFQLEPGARQTGTALLTVPLRLERSAPGTQVTIPGPLISSGRLVKDVLVRPPAESSQATNMDLRFQLPDVVLPLEVERAQLVVKLAAPSRRVTVSLPSETGLVEVRRVESPLDPIRVEIADPRFLRLDGAGGLRVNVTVGEVPGGDSGSAARWTLDYLELEVSGRTRAE